MLKAIVEFNRKFPEGKLLSFYPAKDFKSWIIEFAPEALPQKEPVVEKLRITLKNCLKIEINSVDYQLKELPVKQLSIIAWGEQDDPKFLDEFFSQNKPKPYGVPNEHQDIKEQFHHIYFQGFEVDINVICKGASIQEIEVQARWIYPS